MRWCAMSESCRQPAIDCVHRTGRARSPGAPTDALELAVKGFNLLDETHREYADAHGREIRRCVYGRAADF